MTSFLSKATVIGLSLFLLKNSTDKGQEAYDRSVNWARGVMIGVDLRTFSQELRIEYGFSNRFPRDFPSWIRQNVTRRDGSDPAKDHWGQTIRFTPGNGGSFELRSCGPDGTCFNSDDIVLRER